MSVLTSGFLRSQPKYLPAEVPDAVNTTLAAQSAPAALFRYGTLAAGGRAYALGGLQLDSASGVVLSLSTDQASAPQLHTGAASLLSTAEDPPRVWHADFRDRMDLAAANPATSALSTWWATARIRILRPSVGLKLAQAGVWGPLDAGEIALARKFDLNGPAATGSRWLDFAGIRDRVYAPNVALAAVYGQTVTATSAPVSVVTVNAKQGEILVLRALAVSTGSGSDGLTVTAAVDEDAAFASWPAWGLGHGNPVPCFIQATQQIQLSLSSTAAFGTSATLAASIWHVRITPAIAAHLGQSAPVAVMDAVRAGVA